MPRMWPSPHESSGGWLFRRRPQNIGILSTMDSHRDIAGLLNHLGSPERWPVSGTLQLTVLTPSRAPPRRLSEDDMAQIGTSWNMGEDIIEPEADVDDNGAASSQQKLQNVGEEFAKQDICGICLDDFEAGERLTALPCATDGCSSVWHSHCIREWLNQGQNTACPLCRGKVEALGSETEAEAPPSVLLQVRAAVPLRGASSEVRHITQDVIPELLFLALLSMSEPSFGAPPSSTLLTEMLPGQPHATGWMPAPGDPGWMPQTTGTSMGSVTRSQSWLSFIGSSQNAQLVTSSSSSRWRDSLAWLTSSGQRRPLPLDGSAPMSSTGDYEAAEHAFSGSVSPTSTSESRAGAQRPILVVQQAQAEHDRTHAPWMPPVAGMLTPGSPPLEAFLDVHSGANTQAPVQSPLPPLAPNVRRNWSSRLVAQGQRSISQVGDAMRRRRSSSAVR